MEREMPCCCNYRNCSPDTDRRTPAQGSWAAERQLSWSKIMAVDENSFGGFMMAWRELEQAGPRPTKTAGGWAAALPTTRWYGGALRADSDWLDTDRPPPRRPTLLAITTIAKT